MQKDMVFMKKEKNDIEMKVCTGTGMDILFESSFSSDASVDKPVLSEKRIEEEHNFFELKKMCFHNFSFFDYSSDVKKDTCFSFKTQRNTFVLLFCDKGCACFKNQHLQPCKFCRNSFNLYYFTQKTDFVIDVEQKGKNRYFGMFISEKMFVDIAKVHPFIFKKFESNIEEEQTFALFRKGVLIPYEAAQIFHQIKRCSMMDMTAPLFIGAKIQELFSFVFCNGHSVKKPGITDELRNKIYQARDILEENYKNPPGIKELALLVGTNGTTLKENFKKVFNTTVYGYISSYRMDIAKNLLIKEPGISISDIAVKIGYENQANFAIAFKRKFDVSPSEFRQSNMYLQS